MNSLNSYWVANAGKTLAVAGQMLTANANGSFTAINAITEQGLQAIGGQMIDPTNVVLTGGTIDNIPVGNSTHAVVKSSNTKENYTDSSGTPGNVTNNSPRGRAAFAAAASTVVVTSSLVTAASTVLPALGGADATLTSVRVTPGAGSFTVTGNAAATGITPFDFTVVN